MRAAFYTRQGPAREVLQLGERPDPVPRPGEVLVRLQTSGVNPSDWKSRRGGGRPMFAPTIIPHSDGAGVIEAVGDGVPAERVGERVWIWNGQWQRADGTAAERIALPARQAVRMPDALAFDAAACLGIPGLTALQAVRLAGLGRGARVLIPGGAGAVGRYAIQFAKARGATVLTTVSSEAKAAVARTAGADHVIDYKREDVGARVAELTAGGGVDAVVELDLTSNAAAYPKLLRPRGTVAIYGMAQPTATLPSQWLMWNSITLKPFLVYELSPEDRTACLTELSERLAAGELSHHVGLRLPLDEIATAHEQLEQGRVLGNVVLTIP
ncbi:MAG: NADPH:quinone reductase [Lautropia sp.]